MHTEYFTLDERFRGPPNSGNGGYTCGRIAAHLPGAVAARLKMPPPLNVELRLESAEHESRLFRDATLVGEARCAELTLQPPPAPAFAEAEIAARSYIGFTRHPFPGCFVCGPERSAHDGECIFAGPLQDSSTLAAPWIPHPSLGDEMGDVKREFLWAALDCPGAFAHFPLPDGVALVLGELTASIVGRVRCGERCVVLGWPLGADGRKRLAGTAIYAPDDRLIALARAVWIEVPLSAWS